MKNLTKILKIVLISSILISLFGCATTSQNENYVEEEQVKVEVEVQKQEQLSVENVESKEELKSEVKKEIPVQETKTKITKDEFLSDLQRIILEDKNYQAALDSYKKIENTNLEKDYQLLVLKVKLLNLCNKNEEALEILLSLKKTDEVEILISKTQKYILLSKTSDLLNKNEYSKALELLESDEYENFQNDFEIGLLKASVLLNLKQFDECLTQCDYLDSIKSDSIEVKEIRMEIAVSKEDYKTRNALFKQILAKNPYDEKANCELGNAYILLKKYDNAKYFYKNALVNNENNEEALFGLAQSDYYLENDEEAYETLLKLIEINPENPQAYLFLEKICLANTNYEDAVSFIEKAISLDSSNYEFYLEYGMCLKCLEKYDDAITAWTKAIEIDSTYFLAFAYRAGIYEELKRYEEALADYWKVVYLNPKYYYAYESIGQVAFFEERWDDAIKAFDECRLRNADNISYPLLVTYCYFMKGDSVNAKKYSEKIYSKLKTDSVEYKLLRSYHDKTFIFGLDQMVSKISSENKRGKYTFYLGLLGKLIGREDLEKVYFEQVLEIKTPLFFEYGLAEYLVQ